MAAAHDAVSIATPATGTSRTWSHTNAGGVPTNGTLLVWGLVVNTTDIVTSVTYNGIAPSWTSSHNAYSSGVGAYRYLWKFDVPASGAHNVVISTSSSVSIAGGSWSLTAAAQGALSVVVGGSSASTSNFIVTTDTIINDCVVGMFAANSVSAPTGVGATNTARDITERLASITQITAVVATPAQKYPSFTTATAAAWTGLAFAIGPYVAPGGGGTTPHVMHYARLRRG